MALPENQYGVQALLQELEPRIVGQPRPGHACGCGDDRCVTPAVATKIIPSGHDRPGLEVLWSTWAVQMEPHDGGRGWTYLLDYFVSADELFAMFRQYFGDQKYVLPLAA